MLSSTVIIPTYNRAATLREALQSLASQDFAPGSHEILVIDNGSTDNTAAVIQDSFSRFKAAPTRSIFEPVPGLLSGRHRGALESKSDILIYIDDDVLLGAGWHRAIMAGFADDSVSLLTGPCLPRWQMPPPPWVERLWREIDQGGRLLPELSLLDLGPTAREISPTLVWGLNFSIRRQTLFDLGGFHPDCIQPALQRFQGDGETGLALKAAAKGAKAYYEPKAQLFHVIETQRTTVEYFEKRAFYQGVCDSYTKVRATKGACLAHTRGIGGALNARLRRMLGPAKRALLARVTAKSRPKMPAAFQRRVMESYLNGWRFHHEAAARDPTLLAWVLRDHYFDYQLPGI